MTTSLAEFQVECPSCRAEFEIDPERVPLEGIQAVCSRCLRAFPVELPDDLAGAVESAIQSLGREPVASFEAEPAAPLVADPEPVGHGEVEAPVEEPAEPVVEAPVEEPAEPVVEAPSPTAEADTAEAIVQEPVAPPPPPKPETHDLRSLAEEALAEVEAGEDEGESDREAVASGFSRFGKRDPQERARRLARVLVSDIIAYYPEKHEEAVARGTVKEEFEEEVKKSWKEYVDQVGEEIAESTDYFREALNEVLARGHEVY